MRSGDWVLWGEVPCRPACVPPAPAAGAPVSTVKKHDAGTNKGHGTGISATKLDNETEDFHMEHVSSELKKQIQQGRLAKKLTQAQVRMLVRWSGCGRALAASQATLPRLSMPGRASPSAAQAPSFVLAFPCAAGAADQRKASDHQRVRERQGNSQPPGPDARGRSAQGMPCMCVRVPQLACLGKGGMQVRGDLNPLVVCTPHGADPGQALPRAGSDVAEKPREEVMDACPRASLTS